MEWTKERIEQGESKRGGFSYSQLALLGVSLPPKKGWKRKLIGRVVDLETVKTFIALKGTGVSNKATRARDMAIAKLVKSQTFDRRRESQARKTA
jgi:hypothetical protein